MRNILPVTILFWVKSTPLYHGKSIYHNCDCKPINYLDKNQSVSLSFFDYRSSLGFTLVDLMIAVAIIGVLVAIAVPNIFSEMEKFRLNGATNQIFSHLMAARMKAVSNNRKVKVYFVSDNQYLICEDENQDGTVDNCEGDSKVINIQDNYRKITLSSTNNPIFHSRGTASNLATISITNQLGTKTITIAITGRVRIN